MGCEFWEAYKKAWFVAEELAEKEAEQFAKKPYADRLIMYDNCTPVIKYDDVTREQYKDRKRWGHLDRMVTMYLGTDEGEDIPAGAGEEGASHRGSTEPGIGGKMGG